MTTSFLRNSTRVVASLALLFAGAAAFGQDETARGKALYASQCSICHGPDGVGAEGPVLQGIAGRPVAGTSYNYTPALRKVGGAWDATTLDRFLADPQHVAPGTAMPVRVPDATERRALVAYLLSLKEAPKATAATPAATSSSLVFGDWHTDAPGRRHRIAPSDLPAPFATESARNVSQIVARPEGAWPKVPPGFTVNVFAEGLQRPRQLRVAPNGDVFVSETDAGRVRVLKPSPDGSHAVSNVVFAQGMAEPFGLGFYPASNPRWLYVAETNRVVRFAYPGDRAPVPQVVLDRIAPTSAGHSNRDFAIANDGKWMYLGVGSQSNVAESMPKKPLAEAQQIGRERGVGSAWGDEESRAQVLAFTPEGKDAHAFATGIRNCSGIAVQPSTGALWCSTNERDRLGDDLVPDYVTRVKEGQFFGWPWWYIGAHEDPRLKGDRPDLGAQVTVPEVLLQPHAASLGIWFVGTDGETAAKLPPAWKGSAFAAEHGSWNRANRTGPKLIRVLVDANGAPTGSYEDVMTGFVVDDQRVWGRPVGVTVGKDGSLLVSDDAGGVIWRITYRGS